MNRLRSELAVAPRQGVAISAILATLAAALMVLVMFRAVPLPMRMGLGTAMAVVVFVYGFLVAYVYGDARRRGMRYAMWAVVAAVVPNALGFIAYFLLREPLLRPCGVCGAAARRDFAFCSQCGAAVAAACAQCRRPLEPAWTHCAHCGTKVAAA